MLKYCIYCASAPSLHRESTDSDSAQLSPLLHSFLLPLCLADEDFLQNEDLLQITDYLLNMEKSHVYHLRLVLGLAQPKPKTMVNSAVSDTFLDDVISTRLRKEDNVKVARSSVFLRSTNLESKLIKLFVFVKF